jgi:cellulose synthase (UDP-forming)
VSAVPRTRSTAPEAAVPRLPPPSPAPELASAGAPLKLRVLLAGNLFAASAYVAWWLTPGHVGTPLLFALLACAEAFTLVQLVGLWWAFWSTRVDPPPRPETPFSIDVLIPTRGEPLDVLERTVAAAVAMDVDHQTFVLDDSGRHEVGAMARRLGARYLAGHRRVGGKAANLNQGLARTNGDLVAILDADHVPRPDFIRRLTGYFEDPSLAFVQTPQFYANTAESEVARAAYQQQAIFYGPLCRGKHGLGSSFCCGTNVLFRRAAIQDVGGFDEGSVVEDFVTSMRLHRAGWRSVYYPYILAEGLGPSSLASYFRQQFRWARGSVGALFSLEPFRRGLSIAQRVQYLLACSFYLIGLVTAVYVLLPILYLIGGWSAFSPQSGTFVFLYAPYLFLGLMTIRAGLGGRLRPEHLVYTFGSFPVYAAASLAALLHLPIRFRVTSKETPPDGARVPPLAWVSVGAFALTVVAIGVGVFLRPVGARTTTNIAWGAINLLLLSGIVRVAIREALGDRVGKSISQFAPPLRRTRPSPNGQGTVGSLVAGNGHGPTAWKEGLVLPEKALSPPRPKPSHPSPQAESARRPGIESLGSPLAVLGVLTALGLALRVALIDVQSLRLDEATSIRQARLPLMELWTYLSSSNVHVPLYHVILHFWVQVAGTSEWAIRIPSVVFGTAAIPLLYLAGLRIIGRRAALIAAAAGAAAPFWVWHSTEARMYSLVVLLTLASTVLLFEAVEKGKVWRWGAYAAVSALSLYAHYFALLLPLVHLAYLLLYRASWRKVGAWLGAMGLVAIQFAPWALALYGNRFHGGGGLGSLTNGIQTHQIDTTLYGLLYGVLIFCSALVTGYHGVGAVALASSIVVGAWPLLALSTIMGRRFLGWLRTRNAAFLGSWLVLTIGVVFALSFWRPGLWLQRYLIVATPPLLLLVGLGAARVSRRLIPSVVVVFVVFGFLSVLENVETSNPAREDFRAAAAVIERGYEPRDAVLLLPGFVGGPFEYYFHEDHAIVRVLSTGSPERAVESTIPEIAETHPGAALWIVIHELYRDTFSEEDFEAIPSHLDQMYVREAAYDLGLVEVRRYRLPPD